MIQPEFVFLMIGLLIMYIVINMLWFDTQGPQLQEQFDASRTYGGDYQQSGGPMLSGGSTQVGGDSLENVAYTDQVFSGPRNEQMNLAMGNPFNQTVGNTDYSYAGVGSSVEKGGSSQFALPSMGMGFAPGQSPRQDSSAGQTFMESAKNAIMDKTIQTEANKSPAQQQAASQGGGKNATLIIIAVVVVVIVIVAIYFVVKKKGIGKNAAKRRLGV